MPQGKGTYGSKVGRPKKYKDGKVVSPASTKQKIKKEGVKYSPIKKRSEGLKERARQTRARKKAGMSQKKAGTKTPVMDARKRSQRGGY